MIDLHLIFMEEDIIPIFKEAGIDVKKDYLEIDRLAQNGMTMTTNVLTWIVINPYTQEKERFEPYVRAYLENKKRELFLTEENKLNIINLFNKK